ncbi:hypothetical protein VTK73DRAFT_14 [Phialemonium thermophilum]|uniref:Chorismate synthase protein n=1 Tax=Phialemonium thermophilum TaxID=223376 RepID=A0ABR3Y7N1_9PEZI
MAVISWGTLKSLLFLFGPLLLPKAIAYYKSVQNASQVHGLKVQPVTPKLSRALVVLFSVATVFLIKSLPLFAPENIFQTTQSRLQAPVDVLFTRLANFRPNGTLNPTDTALRAKFVNLQSRLLYLQFGPDTLATCPFCSSDEPRSYLLYFLPSLLTPHLCNLVVIAVATSPLLTGATGVYWRSTASVAAMTLACVDIYLVSTYNRGTNALTARVSELDAFFWSARCYRLAALAGLDALLGWLLYLTATNRAFVLPPSPAERVESSIRAAAAARAKLSATAVVRNAAIRDPAVRDRVAAYWARETALLREAMEERDVVEGVEDALRNRINVQAISRDAEAYAQDVFLPVQERKPNTGMGQVSRRKNEA